MNLEGTEKVEINKLIKHSHKEKTIFTDVVKSQY